MRSFSTVAHLYPTSFCEKRTGRTASGEDAHDAHGQKRTELVPRARGLRWNDDDRAHKEGPTQSSKKVPAHFPAANESGGRSQEGGRDGWLRGRRPHPALTPSPPETPHTAHWQRPVRWCFRNAPCLFVLPCTKGRESHACISLCYVISTL